MEYTKNLGFGNVEHYICRAIYKESYIECICLIHNSIELYLSSNLLKWANEKKLSKMDWDETFKKYFLENKNSSLIVWTEISLLLGIIDKTLYDKLKNFNKKRNDIIHNIYRVKDKKKLNYSDVKTIARLGRECQVLLSPLLHTKQDRDRILACFDDPKACNYHEYL